MAFYLRQMAEQSMLNRVMLLISPLPNYSHYRDVHPLTLLI